MLHLYANIDQGSIDISSVARNGAIELSPSLELLPSI